MNNATVRKYLIAGTIILSIAAALVLTLILTGNPVFLLPCTLGLGLGGAFLIAGFVGRQYPIADR